MKFFKQLAVIIMILLMVSAFTACGSVFDDSETSFGDSDTVVSDSSTTPADENTSTNNSVQAGSTVDESTQAILQPVTVTEDDKMANIYKFIGNWLDTTDDSRYCIIMKTEIGYSYTDNESNFPAEVKDGVLLIHIAVEDADATAKVDDATGILTVEYQDQATTYKKKEN